MSGLGHPARWNVYGERQVDEAGDGGGLGPVRIPLQFVVEQFGGRYGQRDGIRARLGQSSGGQNPVDGGLLSPSDGTEVARVKFDARWCDGGVGEGLPLRRCPWYEWRTAKVSSQHTSPHHLRPSPQRHRVAVLRRDSRRNNALGPA